MIASTGARFRATGLFAACLVGLAITASLTLGGAAAQSQSDPLAAAFSQRDSELQSIKADAAKARALRNSLQREIAGLRRHVEGRKDLPPAQARLIGEQLRQGDAVMRRHAALDRFAPHTDHIRIATDAAYELELLMKALRDDRLKSASAGLRDAAVKAGDATSRLAEISEAYEASISGLSDAIGATMQEIVAMRARARLKSALYGGVNDARYLQLVGDAGKEVADAAIFEPTAPWEIFRPVAQSGRRAPDFALIWDEPEQDWYRVNAALPLEAIFRDAFIGLGKRPSAGRIKYIVDNIAQVNTQHNAATALARYLNDASGENGTPAKQALARLPDAAKVADALRDPEVFRAKFVYDNAFRAWVFEVLDKIRQDLVNQGASATAFLKRLDALLAAHAIMLESQWAKAGLPAKANVRVVAWFSDRPDKTFVSTWMFDREKVTIDANNGDVQNNGPGQGIRSGNVVRSERSMPGRNCVASDERVFEEGGRISFSSVYVCTREDGTLQTNRVSGGGTWEVVSPANDRPASSKL